MKKIYLALILISALLSVSVYSNGTANPGSETVQPAEENNFIVIENGGTGPYSAIVTEDESLPGMTIYRPKDLKPFAGKNKLPVLLWGNGGCANSTDGHKNFLNEIASHGYIIFGIGPLTRSENSNPANRQPTSANQLLNALNWITEQNKSENSMYFRKIEISKVAAMGMSCGGLQAIEISGDPRISTTIVCNSGVLNEASNMAGMPALTKNDLKKYHNPVLYIIGGPTDIAYNNAMDDFSKIEQVPVAMTNFNVGHGGTYSRPHGGAFTGTALAWLNWQLKKDKKASKTFVGNNCGLCEDPEWTIEVKNFK